MLLEALPSEVLWMICERVDFEDIARVSVLNRRICGIVGPVLRKHRRLLSKYGSMEDKICIAPWFWHKFYRSVYEGFEGVKHVRRLKMYRFPMRTGPRGAQAPAPTPYKGALQDWDCEKHAMAWDRSRRQPFRTQSGLSLPPDHREFLKEALESEPWFDRNDSTTQNLPGRILGTPRRQPFDVLGKIGEPETVLALLASRLPKLRVLEIAHAHGDALQLLEYAATHAAISLSQPGSKCDYFRHLRSVDLTTDYQPGEEALNNTYQTPGLFSLKFLSTFMALPSMQKIKVARVRDADFKRQTALPASKVVDLTLLDQDISPRAFAALLDGGAALRSCCLRSPPNCITSRIVPIMNGLSGSYVQWSPNFCVRDTLDILRSNAQQSLETLEIDAEPQNAGWDGPAKHCISLADFTNLKRVSISYDCLDPSNLALSRTRLADLLPSGLETLEIITRRQCTSLAENLLHLVRSSNQPRLKSLKLRGRLRDWGPRELRNECHIRGIGFHGDLAEISIARTKMSPANERLSGHSSMPTMVVDMHQG